MAAQAQLSLHPSRNPYSHIRRYAPDACMALLVVVLGVVGLVAHSWARQIVESWINIHVLFGLLLSWRSLSFGSWHSGFGCA
jgi:hypothetical protein